MSRGLGKIERAIVEVLKKEDPEGLKGNSINFITFEVAKLIGRNFNESLFYRSVLRAIRSLKRKEIVYSDKEDIKEFLPKGSPHGRQGPFAQNIYLII